MVAGVSSLVAGSMSMAAGEYVSVYPRQIPNRPAEVKPEVTPTIGIPRCAAY
jgi:hypothetical protein